MPYHRNFEITLEHFDANAGGRLFHGLCRLMSGTVMRHTANSASERLLVGTPYVFHIILRYNAMNEDDDFLCKLSLSTHTSFLC